MLLPRSHWWVCVVRYVIYASDKRYGGGGNCPLLSFRKPQLVQKLHLRCHRRSPTTQFATVTDLTLCQRNWRRWVRYGCLNFYKMPEGVSPPPQAVTFGPHPLTLISGDSALHAALLEQGNTKQKVVRSQHWL